MQLGGPTPLDENEECMIGTPCVIDLSGDIWAMHNSGLLIADGVRGAGRNG